MNVTWQVLVIGGASAVGKTTLAQQIGIRLGIPWMQSDDLRLAMQRSQVTLPEQTDALSFFESTPPVFGRPAAELCAALLAVASVMTPAIEVVIENHVDTHAPLILEGDSILPRLFARTAMQQRLSFIRPLYLVETDEAAMLSNLQQRGRGAANVSPAEQRMEAHAKWLYGQMLADEAQQLHIPVFCAHPQETLLERVLRFCVQP